MRKLFLLFVIFILMAPAVLAKTIVYVSSQESPLEECSDLIGDDRLFCNELKKLGTVIVKNEYAILTNSWDYQVSSADMIFLGNVGKLMVNKSEAADSFCANVLNTAGTDSPARNIPIFSIGNNNYKNSTSIIGCGVSAAISNLPQASQQSAFLDDNICASGTFKKRADGYVTKDTPNIIPVYSAASPSYIAGKVFDASANTTIWASDECTPRGRPQTSYGVYPAVFTIGNTMFFGPSSPQKFTATMWKFFDRSALYMMNDYTLNFSQITIPEYFSSNGKIMVFGSTSHKNITARVFGDGISKNLTYSNKTKLYESGEFSLGDANSITIYASTLDNLRFTNIAQNFGSEALKINSIKAERTSNDSVKIQADIESPEEITSVKYKVWSQGIELLNEGELFFKDGVFQFDTGISDGNVIIEVDAEDAFAKRGGLYKAFSLGAKPVAGKDFLATPNEWLLSYLNPKIISQTFTLKAATTDLTGIKISAVGDAAAAITIDSGSMNSNLARGNSTNFTATIDLSKISLKKLGKIVATANELTLEIPVEAIVDPAIDGSKQISINPKKWEGIIPEGSDQSKIFNITAVGPYHANEVGFEATGSFAGLLSFEKISLIKSGFDASEKLTLNTKSLKAGKYAGKINLFSSIGNDSIDVNIEVVQDFSKEISNLQDSLQQAESAIITFKGKGADVSVAEQKLQEAKDSLETFQQKWDAQDYNGAKAALVSAAQKANDAKAASAEIKEPFPILLVAGAAILLIIIILLFAFRGKIMGIFNKKKSKPEDQAPEEEKYTPPEEQGSGYRTEYY